MPIRPVANAGWNNLTFHLGDELLVRLPRAAAYSAQVDREQRWLPFLGPRLPLPIPAPVARGQPDEGFPRPWSVYRWLQGTDATVGTYDELMLARDLGSFLAALARIDPKGGPRPSRHNFFRGAPPTVYHSQTLSAIALLTAPYEKGEIGRIWQEGLDAVWDGQPRWFHGDVGPANLLVEHGRLSAVIDFGNMGVGDPACDLAIAWSFFGTEARSAFQGAREADEGAWLRGRCWALWKALILHTRLVDGHPRDVAQAQVVLDRIVADARGG